MVQYWPKRWTVEWGRAGGVRYEYTAIYPLVRFRIVKFS